MAWSKIIGLGYQSLGQSDRDGGQRPSHLVDGLGLRGLGQDLCPLTKPAALAENHWPLTIKY